MMINTPTSPQTTVGPNSHGINMLAASANPPPNPAVGDCYFNTIQGCMFIYAGTMWMKLTDKQEWALFLDDERFPQDAEFVPKPGSNMLIARSVSQAQQFVNEHGLPSQISFDHDLGEGQDVATKFMWWLINGHLDQHWNCAEITMVQVHSANIKGAENLYLLWEGFCKAHDIECDIGRVKALQKT